MVSFNKESVHTIIKSMLTLLYNLCTVNFVSGCLLTCLYCSLKLL